MSKKKVVKEDCRSFVDMLGKYRCDYPSYHERQKALKKKLRKKDNLSTEEYLELLKAQVVDCAWVVFSVASHFLGVTDEMCKQWSQEEWDPFDDSDEELTRNFVRHETPFIDPVLGGLVDYYNHMAEQIALVDGKPQKPITVAVLVAWMSGDPHIIGLAEAEI